MPNLKTFIERLDNIDLDTAKLVLKELYGFDSLDDDLKDEMIETLEKINDKETTAQKLIEEKKAEDAKRKEKEEKSKKRTKKKVEEKKEEGEEKVEKKTRSRAKKTKEEKEEVKEEEQKIEVVEGKQATEKRKTTRGRKKEQTEQDAETEKPKRTRGKKDKAQEAKEEVSEIPPEAGKGEKTVGKEQELKDISIATAEPKEKITEPAREPKTQHIAQILPREEVSKKVSPEEKKKKKVSEQSIDINIGGAVEQNEPVVEIILSDGTRARIDDADFEEKLSRAQAKESTSLQETELEEEYEEEIEEWQMKHKKVHKYTPVPDPDVVERVRRESEERLRKKKEKSKEKGKGKGTVVIDKEKLFGRKEERKGKFDKKDKKKGKYKKFDMEPDETMLKEAAAAVKEFETFGPSVHLKKKKRKKDRSVFFDEIMEKEEVPVIEVSGPMTVENVAQLLEVSPSDIIMDLMDLNIMATKNQLIDLETIRFVAKKYGAEVELVIPEEEDVLVEEPDNPEDLQPRAPVVTVMGHVDHGKTSLLDRVRSTNVVATESGGITQHIAAYEVQTSQGKVVFLDTPGHEAFTQMRARGAKITDIVVLVVAADDGVQPQTIEAIDHAKAAEVPIIVAINKCDKPDAQPDRVRQELIAYDLVDEAWGGKTIMKNISAKTGQGVDELLELIILQSQMMELKANPKKKARGTVVEAEISRGFGPVAWILVQNGTLRVGDVVLVGDTWGKIRAMFNSQEEPVKEAPPSTPVLISGLESLPEAGDTLVVVEDEKKARLIAEKRREIKKLKSGESVKTITLEDFHSLVEAGEQKKLHILIKADVQGSADVLKSSLAGLGNEEVGVEIIRASVGEVNESDILLAQVSKAVIITFHVGVNTRAQKLAEETGVEIRKYEVIYEIIEDVRKALSGLLKPIVNEVVMGHAEIRKVFRSSTFGNIAGCFQVDGTTVRGANARIIRDGKVICEDKIASLRRDKDDVREVSAGFECGIKLEKFEDIKEGDIIEVYRLEEIRPSLN